MSLCRTLLATTILAFTAANALRAQAFEVPVRINLGGNEVVDSQGRTWLGDRPCESAPADDPLAIRVDPLGGTNAICNWCAIENDSMTALGFDPSDAGDVHLLSTIRWDNGGDENDFRLSIPVAPGLYFLNLYFNECCCPGRHFQIEIEDRLALADVSYEDYGATPLLGQVGRLSFAQLEITDGALDLALLPCPECPGVTDLNAILNALELLPAVDDPCEILPDFFRCPGDFRCEVTIDEVEASWNAPLCVVVESYEVFKDGERIFSLPGDATGFTDLVVSRSTSYEVRPRVSVGEPPCPPLTCIAQSPGLDFDIPLRINFGGPSLRDSRGRAWLGDGAGPGDRLDIRRDPEGGPNTVLRWCVATLQAQPASLQALGLDPFSEDDLGIFNTIRWDPGDDDQDGLAGERADPESDVDFHLELPLPAGDYQLNFYFTECCCLDRVFQIELEGDIAVEAVSPLDYAAGVLGRTGLISVDGVSVRDGALSIGLLPCFPGCEGAGNSDAFIDALEVLPAGTGVERCPRNLSCARAADGTVSGSWDGPEQVAIAGYRVLRGGIEIASLGPEALAFVDPDPPCRRRLDYEVLPLFEGEPFCPGLRLACSLANPACPFELPLRINMGGEDVVDSQGRLWLGDRPCSEPEAFDGLGLRPDPLGGTRAICNWCLPTTEEVVALGFNPRHQPDLHLLSTIRWDDGADGRDDFYVEVPLAAGRYDVALYFNECLTANRHFRLEIQGDIVDDDVSYLDYADPPRFGAPGVLRFEEVEVEDVLRLGFLPCTDCPGGTDPNAIINAIEILPSEGGPDGPRFLRGDADATGVTNITDGIFILNFLFRGGPAPGCADAADIDDSGRINLTDGIYLLNFLFRGGAMPLPPFPACGPDPSEDATGCDTPQRCDG